MIIVTAIIVTIGASSFALGWYALPRVDTFAASVILALPVGGFIAPMVLTEALGILNSGHFGAGIGYILIYLFSLIKFPWILFCTILLSSGMCLFALHVRQSLDSSLSNEDTARARIKEQRKLMNEATLEKGQKRG